MKTTFIDKQTVIEAEWLNEVNRSVFDAIGDGTNAPTTPAEVKTNLGIPLVTAVGNDLITAVDAGAARTTISAAASGAVTASGLTMASARLLGRTTGGSGAIEEISVGSGLSLSSGTLNTATATAGTVLQELVFTDAGGSTTSSSLTNITVSQKQITPKSSNSTILVSCSYQGTVAAGGSGTNSTAATQLYDNGNSANVGGETSLGVVSGAGTNMQTSAPGIIRAVVSNAALTTRSFVLRARTSATAGANVTISNLVWSLTEIQN